MSKVEDSIIKSRYISRDLSWLKFNYRVLDQIKKEDRKIIDKLKFLAITASNLDEFFMIRLGSLYNYLDYGKARVDYSGLKAEMFREKLLSETQTFVQSQYKSYSNDLKKEFSNHGFDIVEIGELTAEEKKKVDYYFEKTVFPMLTPMVYDQYRPFPLLMNLLLIFCVVTSDKNADVKDKKKLSFVQIPQNLPRFFEIAREDKIIFVPIENIIKAHISKLFLNVKITSVDIMRITRNGDYTLEESEDLENDFIDEIKRGLKTRKTGRVVRLEVTKGISKWVLNQLMERWDVDDYNIFEIDQILNLSSLNQIIGHPELKPPFPKHRRYVKPLSLKESEQSIFEKLKKQDILLHHPFNSSEPLMELIEKAAEDPNVLAIKLTIYRLAKNSRITSALLKAAENGKLVSALFEIKARFDEENNIKEAQKLQKAGCFVIHGIGALKTHTKMLLIVRKEGQRVKRYVHMSSGNYNEITARFYTDVSLMTTRNEYANDVSSFFNVITGHSKPKKYQVLLTAPDNMRNKLIELIKTESDNAKKGIPSGIVIKINSLQDDKFIDSLYEASCSGVPIKLIIRGICCLRPGRKGISENITVKSIVGDYLEHSRLFYFHNNDEPVVLGGSADAMIRSFDRRIESLFKIVDEKCKRETINILKYYLQDNVNSYIMKEDGSYEKEKVKDITFNAHDEFYKVTEEELKSVKLFA